MKKALLFIVLPPGRSQEMKAKHFNTSCVLNSERLIHRLQNNLITLGGST